MNITESRGGLEDREHRNAIEGQPSAREILVVPSKRESQSPHPVPPKSGRDERGNSVQLSARLARGTRIISFYTMDPGRSAYVLVVLGLLCVLSIFFFHGVTGPYSVVHGPVTALLSMRMASRVRTAIARAGLSVLRSGRLLVASATAMLWMPVPSDVAVFSLSAGCSAILRC